jgi:predicted TIM-barrel fold metal-dependent hydrolase
LFPTLGVLWEHHLRNDPEALYANLHAFNRWLDEDWGFAYRDQIFAAPLLSLADPTRAVQELEWVLDRGARVACMKPGHAHHRSPAHPMFDPFWARVEEAGLLIAFHIGESGYVELYSTDFSEISHPKPNEKSALQWASFYGDRPIMDTFAACILHNLFGRFPKLQLLSVENGSLWVPYLLATMDKMKGMGRNGPWLGGRVEGRPSDIFRAHISVSPYPEDDVQALIDLIGPDRVVMGSDFPHPEGVSEPAELARRAETLDPEFQRLYLRDNAYNLLHPARA